MYQSFLGSLAFQSVVSLICFLSYGTQVLFGYIEPHALQPKQTIIFNLLIACIWVTYLRACFTNPGFVPTQGDTDASSQKGTPGGRQKWCKKCRALKPVRAHHCKICKRCIPKMDHHCPWTVNCVSHRTFPHFLRFLFYAVASMTYLERFLFIRAAVVWRGRNLPSYLGPTARQMLFLFLFLVVNSMTLFALAILLARNIWCLGGNVTTIEGWEIERHETLVYRARKLGGYLNGPDGMRLRLQKQEFPYDIGIYQNIRQGMGSNPLFWLWPFASTPSNQSGLTFETNGFEDTSISWPPPDPDRMTRSEHRVSRDQEFIRDNEMASDQDRLDSFRQRQNQDLKRFDDEYSAIARRRIVHDYESGRQTKDSDARSTNAYRIQNGVEGWQDSEGDRLDDFGVDEEIEFYDEDEVPLAEILRRRNAKSANG